MKLLIFGASKYNLTDDDVAYLDWIWKRHGNVITEIITAPAWCSHIDIDVWYGCKQTPWNAAKSNQEAADECTAAVKLSDDWDAADIVLRLSKLRKPIAQRRQK